VTLGFLLIEPTTSSARLKNTIKENASHHFYLLLNALFISGIIFIGTQVLLFVSLFTALWLLMISYFAYLSIVYGAYRVITSRSVASFLSERYKEITLTYTSSTIIGAIAAFITIPFGVTVSLVITGGLASSKYYFYASVLSLVVFATTGLHFGVKMSPKLSKENLKIIYGLQLEIIRAMLWAFTFTILGTAYTQVLTGTIITSGEMILLSYTLVGTITFVFVPLLQSVFMILDELRDREPEQR